MATLAPDRRIRLVTLLASGVSLRDAAMAVGVSLSNAQTHRRFIKRGACRCGLAPDHPGRCAYTNPGGFKPVDPLKVAAAVALRLDEDLSTEVIARRVGLTVGTAYKVLSGHPRRERGFAGDPTLRWTPAEVDALTRLYPLAPRVEVEAVLPGRTWDTIVTHATTWKVRRSPDADRTPSGNVDPIFKVLRDARLRRGWSVPELVRRVGATVRCGDRSPGVNRGLVTQCEGGYRGCTFTQLRRWSSALGLVDLVWVVGEGRNETPAPRDSRQYEFTLVAPSTGTDEAPLPRWYRPPWSVELVGSLTAAYGNGLSNAEIASALGLTKNQVIGKVDRLRNAGALASKRPDLPVGLIKLPSVMVKDFPPHHVAAPFQPLAAPVAPRMVAPTPLPSATLRGEPKTPSTHVSIFDVKPRPEDRRTFWRRLDLP